MRISDWSSDVCSSDLCAGAPGRNADGKVTDFACRNLGRSQESVDRLRADLQMSFLADPARLPAIVRRLPLGPEMIDEIRGYAVTGDKPGDAIFGAHDESGGGIAVDRKSTRLNSSH